MEKKDKITIIVFIFLIISIIFVVGVNSYKNRKLKDVDRKIEYIMGYTYDTVLNKGSNLFMQTISLLNNKDAFEYTKDLDESIRHYSINDVNNYIKITNFSLAINTFTSSALEDYMEYKKIIYFEDNYFIEDIKNNKNNYIGSQIEINKYDNEYVYFDSINYYCDNEEFIGITYEAPSCNYQVSNSTFRIKLENNTFKVADINEFLILLQ